MKKTLIILVLAFQSCTFLNDEGKLIFTEANPEIGFNFPYFLFIPDSCSHKTKSILIVEPNNSGFTSDDFEEHIEKAERTAKKEFYIGNFISRSLNYPLLVPVFPRADSTWQIYTHALDRDVVLQKKTNLERIDLQLKAMIKDARSKLLSLGYEIDDKILMTGFSASGTFANRFTLIHPNYILAAAAGGLNGILALPIEELNGKELNYPLGTKDFKSIFQESFDSLSFKQTPQFLFMGALDDNDAIPYQDAFDDHERDLIYELLGKEMQPQRWNKCVNIYNDLKINAKFNTYDEVGHEHGEKIKREILDFFKEQITSYELEKQY